MRTIPAGEFKQICLRLLGEVAESGEPIIITKRGRPVVMLAPLPASARPRHWWGCMRGTAEIRGDLVSPASALEEWEALG